MRRIVHRRRIAAHADTRDRVVCVLRELCKWRARHAAPRALRRRLEWWVVYIFEAEIELRVVDVDRRHLGYIVHVGAGIGQRDVSGARGVCSAWARGRKRRPCVRRGRRHEQVPRGPRVGECDGRRRERELLVRKVDGRARGAERDLDAQECVAAVVLEVLGLARVDARHTEEELRTYTECGRRVRVCADGRGSLAHVRVHELALA